VEIGFRSAILALPVSEIRGKFVQSILKQNNYIRVRPYLDGAFTGEGVNSDVVLQLFTGEEFAILLNESDKDSAFVFVERLHESIRSFEFGQVGKITTSADIATVAPEEALKSLQERADSALYCAKEEGRDRAAVAE